MGSLTSRGRALVVVAFVLSAVLAGSAAVALVVASRDDAASPQVLPTIHPTLISPSQSPTPTVTATPTPTATATPRPTATATPSPTAAATSSPTARATSSPRPTVVHDPDAPGLFADASLDPAGGDTTTATVFHLFAHATDGDGSISVVSVTWGDGSSEPATTGTACAAKAPADCRDFAWSHTYSAVNKSGYVVTIKLKSGAEASTLTLKAYVNNPAP